jgi:hypothetical protein
MGRRRRGRCRYSTRARNGFSGTICTDDRTHPLGPHGRGFCLATVASCDYRAPADPTKCSHQRMRQDATSDRRGTLDDGAYFQQQLVPSQRPDRRARGWSSMATTVQLPGGSDAHGSRPTLISSTTRRHSHSISVDLDPVVAEQVIEHVRPNAHHEPGRATGGSAAAMAQDAADHTEKTFGFTWLSQRGRNQIGMTGPPPAMPPYRSLMPRTPGEAPSVTATPRGSGVVRLDYGR